MRFSYVCIRGRAFLRVCRSFVTVSRCCVNLQLLNSVFFVWKNGEAFFVEIKSYHACVCDIAFVVSVLVLFSDFIYDQCASYY